MTVEDQKFDNRSRELKWLMGWVRDQLSSTATMDYRTMRELTLWASAPGDSAPKGMIPGSQFIEWATNEMDARILQSRRRDAGLPYIASRTFEEVTWQAGFRDLMGKQWKLKCEMEPNDRPFLSLYQFARPEEGRRSIIVEQAGDLKFCVGLTEPGSAMLVEGEVGAGKSHYVALVFQWLDDAKDEFDRLVQQGRGDEARLSKLWRVRSRVGGRVPGSDDERRLEREHEDEASVGRKEMPAKRVRYWERTLGIRQAKGLRLVTTKVITPDSPRLEHIVQGHDARTILRDVILNNKAEYLSFLDHDEAVAGRMEQAKGTVKGFMEFNRLRRHFSVILSMCTQDAKGQLPDEFFRSINVRVWKEDKWHVRIKNPIFNDETFGDVPPTDIRFIHDTKQGFVWNVQPSHIATYVDKCRQRWEATHDPKKDPWTEGMTLDAWLTGLPLFTISEADLQRGTNPLLASEIRMHLLYRDPAGRPLTDAQIVKLVNQNAEDDPEGPLVNEERVAEERKRLERDMATDRRRRGSDTNALPDPDAYAEAEVERWAV